MPAMKTLSRRRFLETLGASAAAGALAGCQREKHGNATLPVSDWRAWNLPPEGALLPAPRGVTLAGEGTPAEALLVLDTAGRILCCRPESGEVLRQWRMPETGVGKPEGICALRDGRTIVCDTHYHRILVFDARGQVTAQWGRYGTGQGELIYPVGIAKDDAENLFVCEYGGNDRVQRWSRDGVWQAAFGKFGTAPGELQRPSGLCWHDGRVFVADAINNRVSIYRADNGEFLTACGHAPGALDLPYGVIWNPAAAHGGGALDVIEYGAGRLTRLDPDSGQVLARYGQAGGGGAEGEFGTPWALCADATGHRLWIADTKNRRVVSLRV